MSEKTLIILDPVLRRGFTSIPNCVLFAPDLSMPAKCLYTILLAFAWQDNECWPGQGKLSEAAGCHINTVEKYLKELRDYGLISWKRRGLNRPNIYYIHNLAEVKRIQARTLIKTPENLKTADSRDRVNPESQGCVNQESQAPVNEEYSISNAVVEERSVRKTGGQPANPDEAGAFEKIVEEIRELARSECSGELPSEFVLSLLERFTADQIKEKIRLTGNTTGQIRNLPGFILTALLKDYTHIPGQPKRKSRAGPEKPVTLPADSKEVDKRKELIKRLYLS